MLNDTFHEHRRYRKKNKVHVLNLQSFVLMKDFKNRNMPTECACMVHVHDIYYFL